jgi:hypothetical protein
MSILDALKNPNVLEAAAVLAALAPPPEGPLLAASLRLVKAWIDMGKTQAEIDALVSKYSVEAQALADDWHG